LLKISRLQFLEMFSLGILNGSNKQNKEWTVCCPNKPSRQKTRYVHEAHYNQYLIAKKNRNENKI